MKRRVVSTRGDTDRKPTVLLADDDARVLEAVSEMLADSFDIVGVASDGERALELVARVDPDLVVLDVTMPRRDGFRTARALKRTASRARVVFLTLHDEEEFVAKGFECGADGYVVKTRARCDLAGAADHVLDGRQFVPSLQSVFRLAGSGGGHAMQVHGDDRAFLDGLAVLFDVALQRGDATCLIATEPVRAGLDERLRTRGWNVDGSSRHARYRTIDVDDAHTQFTRDGLPDPVRIAEAVEDLDHYREATAEGAAPRLMVFGMLAGILARSGHAKAAIALEHAWSELTHVRPILTVCGYSAECFDDHAGSEWFPHVCAEHGAVSHAGRF